MRDGTRILSLKRPLTLSLSPKKPGRGQRKLELTPSGEETSGAQGNVCVNSEQTLDNKGDAL